MIAKTWSWKQLSQRQVKGVSTAQLHGLSGSHLLYPNHVILKSEVLTRVISITNADA